MKDSIDDTAIIIFVRNPVLGKVKTRLAKGIGDEKALKIYEILLRHTFSLCSDIPYPKQVFYADGINAEDLWNYPNFFKREQKGADLGERMQNAFSVCFSLGFKKVLIIGSDCYQLTSSLILQAAESLSHSDVVLGPTHDGGYYLLGLCQLFPELFSNKAWSTSSVAADTINDFKRLNLSHTLLKKLHDVDEAADLEANGIVI